MSMRAEAQGQSSHSHPQWHQKPLTAAQRCETGMDIPTGETNAPQPCSKSLIWAGESSTHWAAPQPLINPLLLDEGTSRYWHSPSIPVSTEKPPSHSRQEIPLWAGSGMGLPCQGHSSLGALKTPAKTPNLTLTQLTWGQFTSNHRPGSAPPRGAPAAGGLCFNVP